MKFLSNEKLSSHKYKTQEGYLICTDAILARTGKQEYKRSEVFGDYCKDSDKTIEVNRTEKEVFSDATLASFENKPITIEHPNEDVNSTNWKDYQVGFVRDVRRGKTEDGQDVIIGNLVIQDEQTINEILDGQHCELSCGYDCDIIDEDNPQQRNIRGNHVALCEQGRAGVARIVDSNSINDVPEGSPIEIQKREIHIYGSQHKASLIKLKTTVANYLKENDGSYKDRLAKEIQNELDVLKRDYDADMKDGNIASNEIKNHYRREVDNVVDKITDRHFKKIVDSIDNKVPGVDDWIIKEAEKIVHSGYDDKDDLLSKIEDLSDDLTPKNVIDIYHYLKRTMKGVDSINNIVDSKVEDALEAGDCVYHPDRDEYYYLEKYNEKTFRLWEYRHGKFVPATPRLIDKDSPFYNKLVLKTKHAVPKFKDSIQDANLSTIEFLIKDEEEAIKGYEDAIKEAKATGNEVAVTTFQHILEEEMEHIQELKDLAANDIHDSKNVHDSNKLSIEKMIKFVKLVKKKNTQIKH